MNRHLTNTVCGVIDYVSYPVAMLFVAPFALRHLGAAQFGLWMMAAAIISSGGIIASSISDANLRRVACLLQINDHDEIRKTVRTIMAISLAAGLLIALLVALATPLLAGKIATQRLPATEVQLCFLIAATCIPLRAIHAAAVSTQKAFLDYRSSVRITTLNHLVTLALAAFFSARGHHTPAILVVTAACLLAATGLQLFEVAKLIGAKAIIPKFYPKSLSPLLSGGAYLWLQTLGAVVADRTDRLLLGFNLGAAAVAPYALCVQFAQPLHGITASALSFLMPHLAGKSLIEHRSDFRRRIKKAIVVNVLLVIIGATLMLTAITHLLAIKVSNHDGAQTLYLFPRVVSGSAFLALSVTGTYILQALGKFRMLAALSLGSRLTLFPIMLWLLHHSGVSGLATYRLIAGVVSLGVYIPILFSKQSSQRDTVSAPMESSTEGARA